MDAECDPDSALSERLEELFGSSALSGNELDTLVNGNSIFPAMLEAINSATQEICLETFVYWSGDIAGEFASALANAARRGVVVSVLLDWWGAQKMDPALIDQMRDAGAAVFHFNPLQWWQLRKANFRTHRKILVVDGAVGFTGGVGIAEEWCGDARNPQEWHELHYRIVGPVVAQLREAFTRQWSEVVEDSAIAAHGVNALVRAPENNRAGPHTCQLISSSPRCGSADVYHLFRYALETARKNVRIITAYFVPDKETIAAMQTAVGRGVAIEVMVPGPYIDSTVVRYSSRASWGELLSRGVKIFVYQQSMLHAKAMVIDKQWVIIGSANFDNRSFALNDEITTNVLSDSFAEEHVAIFERDKQRCEELSYKVWKQRGLVSRGKEWAADFFRPQL